MHANLKILRSQKIFAQSHDRTTAHFRISEQYMPWGFYQSVQPHGSVLAGTSPSARTVTANPSVQS